MAKIIVYTARLCPYCHMAKRLLRKKGWIFEEIDVSSCTELRAELREKAGGSHTVPQIWIDELHIGGCDDLYTLDRGGMLDPLLTI